jgi:hypothetical protein
MKIAFWGLLLKLWQETPNFVKNRTKISEVLHEGKAIPVQTWRGPDGSRRIRLPDFKTIST